MEYLSSSTLGGVAGGTAGVLLGVVVGGPWVVVAVLAGVLVGVTVGSRYDATDTYGGLQFRRTVEALVVVGFAVATFVLVVDPLLTPAATVPSAEGPTIAAVERATAPSFLEEVGGNERAWALPVWVVGVVLSWVGFRYLYPSDGLDTASATQRLTEDDRDRESAADERGGSAPNGSD